MSAIIKGQEVTRQGLADIFGVSLPTIDNWVRQGCPYISKGGRGQEWKFNTASVSTWLRDRDVEEATGGIPDDLEELKLREQKAKTELTELELAERKGDKKVKYFTATHKGTALITVLPEQVQSPLMTAEWEEKLKVKLII